MRYNQKILCTFMSAVSLAVSAPSFADTTQTKVSDYVLNQFKKDHLPGGIKPQAEVMVIFEKQATFEEMKTLSFPSREDKIQYVYKKLVDVANESQLNFVKRLNRRGYLTQRFFISNAVLILNATQSLVNELAQAPEISKIVGNPSLSLKLPDYPEWKSSKRIQSVGSNLVSVGADKVWNEFNVRGEGIVVAGQDTGVQWDHPALKSSYRGIKGSLVNHNYSWHDAIKKPFKTNILRGEEKNVCGYDLKAPCDDDQHGTHTMGTMVGDDGADNQVGVAPKSKWIACRNMDAGSGKPTSYLDCFQFFLAPTPLKGNPFTDGNPAMAPHVINNSWGCPPEEGCSGDEFVPAMRALKEAGIMVVVSAGNSGPDCGTIQDPPAWNTQLVLSVGAHDHRTGKIAYFSSRGPSKRTGLQGPNVTAPGVSIRSTVPGSGYEGGMWSGTSMAGPHVAGEVALIWSAAPDMIGDIDGTIALIQATAEPVAATTACGGEDPSATPNNTYGYGRIRIYEAVKAALSTHVKQGQE